ncbi:alpha/beta hydrolase-fold protein [Aquimarina sp. 2201CG5-10]|uniref:alpha/beta hydrolase-fold protein n=1 Tax=Aquimarina callyspongiae TaxID=3098150 RepID=UPI002AB59696|nr:alpha/beta hydrolase-fold protein [Aquimarina sp. 2201CG5-10]MDY8136565.1 alpha/beta hydrolase-fold protein [Aquimarina sp. 2201CG5-10]
MKVKIFFSACLLLSLIYTGYSQIKIQDNTVGKNIIIPSKVLNQDRKIQILLPKDYNKTSKGYPVIYILDGQRLFHHAISISQSFKQFKLTPDFIIVGINNTYPDRFGHFSTGTASFLNFISNEVIPFVDQKYNTSQERLLFGWEYGGGFVIEAMTKKLKLFKGYIAASPFPIQVSNLPVSTRRVKRLDSILENHPNSFLYFTSAINEGMVTEGAEYLKNKLESKSPKNLRWNYIKLQNEEHRSTPYHTLYHGVKQYYYNYKELTFHNLKEYQQLGGMDYVISYYKKRAERFGFSEDIAQGTMWSLVRKSFDENNYTAFDSFIKEFKPKGFLEKLRTNWGCTFAEFYLKHNQPEKAKVLYDIYIHKSPNSARSLNGMGDVYRELKHKEKATIYYKKAIKLAKENADWRLEEYKKDLEDLDKK